jgi:hypothetical protein
LGTARESRRGVKQRALPADEFNRVGLKRACEIAREPLNQ